MMTGGTREHGSIVRNLLVLLHTGLDRNRWDVLAEFGIDVRPGTVRYPDIVVDRRGARRGTLTAEAPVLVAEVLSPSIMKIDLGDKAADYLQLPSLAAYLIFAQDEIKAWAYTRRGEGPFPAGPQIFARPEASIGIASLGLDLRLADIYSGIDFAD